MSKILDELSSAFDLPADALAGEIRATLCGENLLIEGECRVTVFSPERTELKGRGKRLVICGDGLLIRAMKPQEMLVSGRIVSLELE